MTINHAYFTERLACPVCGDSKRTVLYDAPLAEGAVRDFIASHFADQGTVDWRLLDGTDFTIVECPICALIYQVAVPNDALLEQIYTVMIGAPFLEAHERGLLTLDAFEKVAGELTLLFRQVGKAPGDVTFLDYGFGYGRWARVARALGATVYATEIGEDKARAAAALGVRMIEDAKVDTMRFDIVHTEQVFEHLTTPGATFRRLAQVTDGVFKVAVPRGGDIASVLKRHGMVRQSPFARGGALKREDYAYVAIQPLEHLNTFAPRTMDYLAETAGMRIVSRSRLAQVTTDVTTAGGLARSLAEIGKEIARRALRPNTGYYLFAPAERR